MPSDVGLFLPEANNKLYDWKKAEITRVLWLPHCRTVRINFASKMGRERVVAGHANVNTVFARTALSHSRRDRSDSATANSERAAAFTGASVETSRRSSHHATRHTETTAFTIPRTYYLLTYLLWQDQDAMSNLLDQTYCDYMYVYSVKKH